MSILLNPFCLHMGGIDEQGIFIFGLIASALVGLLAGIHTATWGMYKDAPYEGFRHYPRSIILSTLIAPVVFVVFWIYEQLDSNPIAVAVLIFGITYSTERAFTELYKTFLRFEDQSKYTIPMQFHLFGRVIPQGPIRWLVGFLHVAAVLGIGLFLSKLGTWEIPISRGLLFFLVGSLGGWFSAVGGAFKDAPIEGFETLKFFRSPFIAGAYGWLLSHFSPSFIAVAIAALGYTIATLETYKTFFFPDKPRGKFAGKPILFPQYLKTRQKFVPIYIGIWVLIILGWGAAFME